MTEDLKNEIQEEQIKEEINEKEEQKQEENKHEVLSNNKLGGGVEDDIEIVFGKPETYDFKEVKLPENMTLDENMTGKFLKYASKLDLSQKSANEMVAMAVELTEQARKNTLSVIEQQNNAKIEGYLMTLKNDEEIGGAKLDSALKDANVAYEGFFKDEELRNIFASSGLTVHPKFIKALKEIGQEMKEDTIQISNFANTKRNPEDILYPTMKDIN